MFNWFKRKPLVIVKDLNAEIYTPDITIPLWEITEEQRHNLFRWCEKNYWEATDTHRYFYAVDTWDNVGEPLETIARLVYAEPDRFHASISIQQHADVTYDLYDYEYGGHNVYKGDWISTKEKCVAVWLAIKQVDYRETKKKNERKQELMERYNVN